MASTHSADDALWSALGLAASVGARGVKRVRITTDPDGYVYLEARKASGDTYWAGLGIGAPLTNAQIKARADHIVAKLERKAKQ